MPAVISFDLIISPTGPRLQAFDALTNKVKRKLDHAATRKNAQKKEIREQQEATLTLGVKPH
jgi:hypothetical protein